MTKDTSLSPDDSGSYESQRAVVDESDINWAEACSPPFMAANTDAPDFESFARAGGFDISSEKGIEAILPSELDAYVSEHTRFDSWSDMKIRAFADWKRRKEAELAGVSPRTPKPMKASAQPADTSDENQRRRSDRPLAD